MRVRWRGLELPTKVELDKTVSTDSYGKLHIEPFERGFGTTLGNSLRRILLSSLEGSAVTAIKIDNASHEFSSITGVLEDVTDIILNIKSLVVQLDANEPRMMTIEKKGPGLITAGDAVMDPAITLVNPEHKIATLTDDVNFRIELTVDKGRGYVSPTEVTRQGQEVGVIAIDAIYSPVTRVRYRIDETRVGQSINYDRLEMEIWTDGTVSPEMSLVESAKILRKHLGPFIQYFEVGQDHAVEKEIEEIVEVETVADEELQKKLDMSLSDLELSVRAMNCLEMGKFDTVGQLVVMDEPQLMALRSFGKTSLREVKRKLEEMGLELGMKI